MSRTVIALAVLAWIGLTLVLSELRTVRRPALARRITPFGPAPGDPVSTTATRTVRDIIAPPAIDVGNRLAGIFGVHEELAVRLARVHSPLSVSAFRTRQLGWALAGFGAAVVIAVALAIEPFLALAIILGAPLLAFLGLEQQLAQASVARQRRLVIELPVVSEQLGMLLSAGYSLGAALQRLARRGEGVCATDLTIVCGRIRHGLDDLRALREWAAVERVDALDRLVAVLALNREASDLGHLITEESRVIRQEVQRELIETVERRSQQVWIPVTVATLVPGVLFLAVPFVEAMRLFTSS